MELEHGLVHVLTQTNTDLDTMRASVVRVHHATTTESRATRNEGTPPKMSSKKRDVGPFKNMGSDF